MEECKAAGFVLHSSSTKDPKESYEEVFTKNWNDEIIWAKNLGDYFSFCGYFRFHTPFSGEPRLDSNNFKGLNVHYRTRNLDAIPFRNKIKFNLENAVFWYGEASTKANGVVEYNF